jgi:hypothetical protein
MASLVYSSLLGPNSQLTDLTDEQQAIAKLVFKDKQPLEVMLAPEGSTARLGTQIASYALFQNGKVSPEPFRDVTVPGNCYVTVTNPTGQMAMGWAFPFDAQGHAVTSGPENGASWQADSGFPVPGVNSYCALVQVESGGGWNPIVLVDKITVPNYGAGISSPPPGYISYWTIAADQGGEVYTVYNDNYYPDNNGYLTFVLTVYSSLP